MRTLDAVCEIILMNVASAKTIHLDAGTTLGQIGADDLDMMAISNSIRTGMGVEITSTQLSQLETVGAITQYIDQNRQQ